MNSPLSNVAKIQVLALSGFEFQAFIILLMHVHYGSDAVQELRNTKDDGADCLISKNKICIACYAPEKKVRPAEVQKKMTKDFSSYQNHWQNLYPSWHFYTNFDPSPAQIRLVVGWGGTHKIHGCSHILKMIETDIDGLGRAYPHRYRLYKQLGVGPEYLGQDFLRMLLNDLKDRIYKTDGVNYLKKAPEILRKICANSSPEESEEFHNLVNATFELQSEIEQALGGYDNPDINVIKNRIVGDYYQCNLPISGFQKLKQLIGKYESRYNGELNDDMLSAYIAALVWYMFVQCHIGIAPEE